MNYPLATLFGLLLGFDIKPDVRVIELNQQVSSYRFAEIEPLLPPSPDSPEYYSLSTSPVATKESVSTLYPDWKKWRSASGEDFALANWPEKNILLFVRR